MLRVLFPSSVAIFVFSSPLDINVVEVKNYRNWLCTLPTQPVYDNMFRLGVSPFLSSFQCSCLGKKMFLLWVITILSSGTELRFLRDHLYYKGSLCPSSVLGSTFQLPNQTLFTVFENKLGVLLGLFKKKQ